ncbi:MAG: rane-bound lytic murein transglycosylase [Nevskia sp.]|nr:rane-bound lytic murein transglycosylase [Nevskia sp.]
MSRPLTRGRKIALYATLGCALALSTCSPRPSALQRVFATEHLRVAMVESPTTCYNAGAGPTGFECDLLGGLAKRFGVALDLHFVDSAQAALDLLQAGQVDLAAGGIPVDTIPPAPLRFTAPLENVVLQLVSRADRPLPTSLDKLNGEIRVVDGSGSAALLEKLALQYPKLRWSASTELSEEDLLDAVAEGEVDYTIASSTLIAIEQRYYPSLRVAFDVTQPAPVAWALRGDTDKALYRATQDYLQKLGEAELARVRDRYFGHVIDFDYQGVSRFADDVTHRLPRYRQQFRNAAQRYGLDWRVLAAVGYQESHWDPDAISRTGVRGLMMLTEDTAAELAVTDRQDPAQSISGGARYLAQILKLLPPEIVEPDRTWMALAAYNQGIAHLEDARQLAAKHGGDPNRWLDVRNTLPLLSRPQWFKQTRAGYARGREAVNFVGNVRNYYDILSWLGNNSAQAPPASIAFNTVRSADARRSDRGAGDAR